MFVISLDNMKVIYNKHLPPGKFAAINLFGIIFARNEYKDLSRSDLNHEKIHSYQILEMLGIFYYVAYFTEWLVRLIQYKNPIEAYRNISFEREAYGNHDNLSYLNKRKPYAFIKYYKRRKL